MWPEGILETLHNLPHLSISLRPVSNDFSLSQDYVQSQMLLIVVTLGLGFSMLLLIAVLLCAVITFFRPIDTPILPARIAVMAVAIAMALAATAANDYNEHYSDGLDELVLSLEDLRGMAEAVQTGGASLVSLSRAVDTTSGAIAHCCGCPAAVAPAPPVASVMEPTLCESLELRRVVALQSDTFATDTGDGAAHFTHAIDTLRYATGWHSFTTSLPLFALLSTAAAVNIGTCLGRCSLLVGAQLFAVIVWWMMCAITAVQLAIAMGLADACCDPTATVVRVLTWFALQGKDPQSDTLSLQLAHHFLQNCSLPTPLSSALMKTSSGLHMLSSNLTRVGAGCSTPALLEPAQRAIDQAQAMVTHNLALLAGQPACDRVRRDWHNGVENGLCGDITQAVVGVLVWQGVCGGLLLLLAALLPALWHSHWLPPMSCACQMGQWHHRFRRLAQSSDTITTRLLTTDEPLLHPLSAASAASAAQPSSSPGGRTPAGRRSALELSGAGEEPGLSVGGGGAGRSSAGAAASASGAGPSNGSASGEGPRGSFSESVSGSSRVNSPASDPNRRKAVAPRDAGCSPPSDVLVGEGSDSDSD